MIKRRKKICKLCKNEEYIFSKGICIKCYKPKPIKKTQTVIKKISSNQSKRNQKYLKLREKYLKQEPVCEVCRLQKSSEIHHRKGRDGDNLFNEFLAVCRDCHNKIENNPEWAKENNYTITRLN